MGRNFFITLGVCLALLIPEHSYAQNNSSSFFGVQDGLFAITKKREETFADVGLSYVYRDGYVGSEETESLVLPYVRADYKGRLFINPALGAGIYWRNTDNFRFSSSLNFETGRDDEDAPILGENGDLDSSFSAVNAARVYLPFAGIDIVSTVPFTGDFDGARLDVLLSTEFYPFKGLRITPGVRATLGTSDWVNSLYGVDADDIAAEGASPTLEAFDADSGLIAFGAHTAAYWDVTRNYQIVGVVNYSNLRSDARDSPLSPDNNGLTVALALVRSF